jgi:uncharacterized protein
VSALHILCLRSWFSAWQFRTLKKLQASTLEKTMLASAITILLIQGTFQLFRAGLEIFFHHITLTYIVVTITAINYFNNDLEKREDA